MPNRIVREGILESERVDRLSCEAEVFYRRAMSKVDDAGRYYAKPELLLAALFPLRIGRVSPTEIAAWLRECAAARLVRLYTVEGKAYLEIVDFRQQMRSRSKFPDPPAVDDPLPATVDQLPSNCEADAKQMHSKRTADAHLFVFESVSVSGADRGLRARASQTTSPDFETAWGLFPKREGGNPKRAAWKAWQARTTSGANPSEMIAGTRRYAAHIRATGKEGTPYVLQARTFFGPDEHYREPWGGGGEGATSGALIEDGAML